MASGVVRDLLADDPALAARLLTVLGEPGDPFALVERRAADLLADLRAIVWEGDPATFRFTHVSGSAADLLGYPCERWLADPMFWADTLVHPEDRDEALALCAMSTGQCKDHDFRYRAVAADGRTVELLDVVQVLRGHRGVAERLRGLMIDVT
jgi:PAS domain-containing protein